MTAWNEIHGYFVFALQAETVDSNIGIAGFRIGAVAKPHGYIWAGVFFSIGRGWDQLADIKALFCCQMHYFLTGCLVSTYNYRSDRGGYGVF